MMGRLELGQVLADYKNVQQSRREGRNFAPANKGVKNYACSDSSKPKAFRCSFVVNAQELVSELFQYL